MNFRMWRNSAVVALGLVLLASALAWAQTPVPQSTLWRVLVGDNDRMTVINSLERSWFVDEGQIFYIPICQPAGTTPIYRLYNWSNGDHRDSLYPIEGSLTEWAEGCGWNLGTPLPGLAPMFEAFNPTSADYALVGRDEILPGYTRTALGLMGYPRYKNEKEVLLNVRGSRISVDSNLVAGGNVWHWNWNGLQFLNIAGYARGMHTEIWGLYGTALPYETGDWASYFPDEGSNIHGAPLVAAFTVGERQTTLAVPIEYLAEDWGGDIDHPVLWQDLVLGKELELDFNNDPSVARYRAYLYYPAPNDGQLLAITTVMYLRGIFTRYFTYDAVADQFAEITSELPACAARGRGFAPAVGGMIVSDASGRYAIGFYGADASAGGTLGGFSLRPRICPENGGNWIDPGSEASMSTVVLRYSSDIAPAQKINSFNRYVVTNTLENVRRTMRRLYQSGVR